MFVLQQSFLNDIDRKPNCLFVKLTRSTQGLPTLNPAEIDTSHLVKSLIKRSIKISQSLQYHGINVRMAASLRLPQAARRAVPLALKQTREPLGRIEIEMLLVNDAFQPQKILHTHQLNGGIDHESLPAYEQKLRQREAFQPPTQVPRVNTELYGPPARVYRVFLRAVHERQDFEREHVVFLRNRLRVIGNRPGHRVSDHDQQFSGGIHELHATRRLFRDEIRRRLFDRQLALEGRRQTFAIPLEALRVELVEKVYFVAGRADVGVDADEFEQGARAALLNAYYEGVRQLSGRSQALLAQETVFRGYVRLVAFEKGNHAHRRAVVENDMVGGY